MPSRFDEADRRASAAMGRIMETPRVRFTPMRRRTSRMTGGAWEPDPTRPTRDLDMIVSWRSETHMAGDAQAQGQLLDADCLLDADRADFPNQDAVPRKGDAFRLRDPYMKNTTVEVDKVIDDGSARLLFFCNFPE